MATVSGAAVPDEITRIARVLATYFDALYEGDVEKFASIFHPDAMLFCATAGEVVMGVEAYLALVAGRASPASRGDPRRDEIVAITVASPTTAHARVRELFLPKHFTDELTLMLTGGDWKIVSKVWHFDLVAADAVAPS